ncbi:hypothetical protein ACEWY4_005909 [Coilia grayii]|uniref:Protein kinase domain-containing protein n=1 Tax=Coilia grayii TaxID=363190 RepID=A0ABD1KJT3_9TELE
MIQSKTHSQNANSVWNDLQGSSSLRFRPIRRLNSLVEDLKMYKVVGISDKVLTVESLVCKETFVVKSLLKSSGNSHNCPTIIPQNVPFMVKLLRYYVSEDSVYLHLEHVKGGTLFSKLHKLRGQAAKDHPECFSISHHHNSCTLSTTHRKYGQDKGRNISTIKHEGEPPEIAPAPASWHEAQYQMENCRTHSYSEETGCLQHSKLNQESLINAAKTEATSHKSPGLPVHYSAHSDQQASPTINSEFTTNYTGPDMQNSELDIVCNVSDPLQKCETCRTVCSGGSCAADNVQTSWKQNTCGLSLSRRTCFTSKALQVCHPSQSQYSGTQSVQTSQGPQQISGLISDSHLLSTQGQMSNAEIEKTTVDTVCFPRQMNSEITRKAINRKSNRTSSSGNGRSPTALSIHDIGLLHINDSAGRAFPRTSEEILQKAVEEERWGQLGSLHKEKPQRKDLESGLGSASSGFIKEAGIPTEYSACEQIIEVDGWHQNPQGTRQTSSGKPQDEHWGLPEADVQTWGAQILMALESLHDQGIICCDLNPNNILLSTNGMVCLTYFGQWSEVQPKICPKAMQQMYCAPEIGGVARVTEACDWWSLGALLFELLTGMPLWQCHPTGVNSHTQLHVPDHLSTAAASLLTELLQLDAGYRLGSGGGGVSDIKCHPFFHSVVWSNLDS